MANEWRISYVVNSITTRTRALCSVWTTSALPPPSARTATGWPCRTDRRYSFCSSPTTSLLLLPPSAFFHRLSDLMLILPFWFCSQLILIVAPCRELPTPDITPDIDQKLRACCIFPLLTFLLFLFLFGYLPSVSARTSFCIGHYYNSIPVSTVSIYSQRQQIVTPSLKMIT